MECDLLSLGVADMSVRPFQAAQPLRPPKGQARRESTGSGSASPGTMAADCEWQGDAWRRPSRWSGQWDQGTLSTPTTPQSVPSTPPPMPAPPPEPQTNLIKDTSSPEPWWAAEQQDGEEPAGKESPTPWRKDGQSRNESPGPPQQQRHRSTLTPDPDDDEAASHCDQVNRFTTALP
ncbi:putative golgin subfamily A member 6-like 2 [Homarus americanus]|uniref:Putative golgin subfamily A member 6-like 2 n=1 Tax=Homarus americanus TaxID=6706 RepID=A0A8J5JHD0_HOMAM|nr:putative golgin subfamily A member 6-like 2 [Homarus americanus]